MDLWSASGNVPGDFLDVSERAKDIQYSSRTRAITNLLADRQKHALFIKQLLAHIPADVRETDPLFRLAEEAADASSINVMHLIYKNKPYEGHYKDYEFSIDTMEEHWKSGLEDIGASFAHPDRFEVPSRKRGFVTHDVHREGGSVPQSDRVHHRSGKKSGGLIRDQGVGAIPFGSDAVGDVPIECVHSWAMYGHCVLPDRQQYLR